MDWVNPYRAGQPVAGGDAFVGRQDVLDEVRRILTRPGAHAASMVGQRRIGKTSVLHRLREWLPTAGPFRPVFYDLSDGVDKPVHETLLRLARAIAREVGIVAPARLDQAGFREHFLPKAVEQLPAGTSLVLLLDEFDVLARGGGEGAVSSQRDFFQYLRELIERAPPRVGVIVAMGRNIADLEESAGLIFKGIDTVRVGMLTPAQSAELAALGPGLTWTKDAVEELWHQCGGQPYLTQRLCLEIWERAEKPARVDVKGVYAACERTLVAAEGALDWLWNGLSPANQIVAAALAGAGAAAMGSQEIDRVLGESGIRIIYELDLAPKQLEKWDLLRAEGEKWVFRSELLRRWIAQHHPLKEVRRLLDRISDEAEQYYRLAIGAERRGQTEKLREHLNAALENNPNHAGATLMLADLLKRDGDLDGAITRLEGLYAVRPEEARRGLVEALLATDRYGRGPTWARGLRAMEVSPGEARATEILVQLAPVLAAEKEGAGDFAAAEAIYAAAGMVDGMAIVRARRAAREEEQRKEAERVAELERRYRLALLAEEQGDRDSAERLLAGVVSSGGFRDSRDRLARLLVTRPGPGESASGETAVADVGAPPLSLPVNPSATSFFAIRAAKPRPSLSAPAPRTSQGAVSVAKKALPSPADAWRFRPMYDAPASGDATTGPLTGPAQSDDREFATSLSADSAAPGVGRSSMERPASRGPAKGADFTAGFGAAVIGAAAAIFAGLVGVEIAGPDGGLAGLGVVAVAGWGFAALFVVVSRAPEDLFFAAMCLLPSVYALVWWLVVPT